MDGISSESVLLITEGEDADEPHNTLLEQDFNGTTEQYAEEDEYGSGEVGALEEGHDGEDRSGEVDQTNDYGNQSHMAEEAGQMMKEEEKTVEEGVHMMEDVSQNPEAGGHLTEEGNHMTEEEGPLTKEVGDTTQSGQKKEGAGHMTREDIEASLEQILEDVRAKRENDLKMVSEVKAAIMAQAEKVCSTIEQHMYSMHTRRTQEMNNKVAGLGELLEKIKHGEAELSQTKLTLRGLCEDMYKYTI